MPKVAIRKPQSDRVQMSAPVRSEKQKKLYEKYGYWHIDKLSYVDFPKPVTKYEDWPECNCDTESGCRCGVCELKTQRIECWRKSHDGVDCGNQRLQRR